MSCTITRLANACVLIEIGGIQPLMKMLLAEARRNWRLISERVWVGGLSPAE